MPMLLSMGHHLAVKGLFPLIVGWNSSSFRSCGAHRCPCCRERPCTFSRDQGSPSPWPCPKVVGAFRPWSSALFWHMPLAWPWPWEELLPHQPKPQSSSSSWQEALPPENLSQWPPQRPLHLLICCFFSSSEAHLLQPSEDGLWASDPSLHFFLFLPFSTHFFSPLLLICPRSQLCPSKILVGLRFGLFSQITFQVFQPLGLKIGRNIRSLQLRISLCRMSLLLR